MGVLTLTTCCYFWSDQPFPLGIRPFSHSRPCHPCTDHSDEQRTSLLVQPRRAGLFVACNHSGRSTLELCWPSPPPGPTLPTSVASPTCQAVPASAFVLVISSAWCCVLSAFGFPRCRMSFSAPPPMGLEGRRCTWSPRGVASSLHPSHLLYDLRLVI